MRVLSGILTTLFKPAKGVDSLADVLKWLWIPLAIVLAVTVVGKAVIATPMSLAATADAQKAAMEQGINSLPEAERAQAEKDLADSGALEAANTIASTAAIVFGMVGAFVALLYIATFFFVAAKTWAMPVKYSSLLSIAGLSLVPHMIRNVIQAVYMASTGVWLQHQGLGALVAPKDIMTAPSAVYAILAQVDLWVIWGVVIIFGALMSETVGLERKRAVAGVLAFVVITGIIQAVPTIVTGVFMGAAGM